MKSHVYADHAATSPLCDAAWDAMVPFFREEFGNPSSLHSWAKKNARGCLDGSRDDSSVHWCGVPRGDILHQWRHGVGQLGDQGVGWESDGFDV